MVRGKDTDDYKPGIGGWKDGKWIQDDAMMDPELERPENLPPGTWFDKKGRRHSPEEDALDKEKYKYEPGMGGYDKDGNWIQDDSAMRIPKSEHNENLING